MRPSKILHGLPSILPKQRLDFVLLMANSELLSDLPIDLWRDFVILAFSFHKEVRFCKSTAKSYIIVDNPYTQTTDNCSLRGKILEVFPAFFICGWDFQAETGLIRYTLTIALI